MSKQAELKRHARQEFAAPGGPFDRMIGAIRIALPVGVGIIVGILAIAPLEGRNEFSFLLDRNEVQLAEESLRVESALYRGEDKQGQPFSLRASAARQRSSNEPIVEIEGMEADFTVGDDRTSVTAQRGDYDLDTQRLAIPGPTQLTRANGDELTASDVVLDLDNKLLRSAPGDRSKGVRGRSGFGTYRADSLFARLADRRLILAGSVSGTTDFGRYSANRLIYDFESGNVMLDGNARLRIN